MERRTFGLLLIAFFASSLSAAEPQPSEIHWERDLQKGRAAMKDLDRPMLLYLTAPGCIYCEQMKQETFNQQWIIEEIGRKYLPVLINGREHKVIADRLRVRMFPTIAIVHPTGKVVEIVRGYRNPAEFLKHMAVAKAKLDIHSKQVSAKATTTQVASTQLKSIDEPVFRSVRADRASSQKGFNP